MPNISVSITITERDGTKILSKTVPYYMDKLPARNPSAYVITLDDAFKMLKEEVIPFLYANQTTND